jgi:hypothetical protein
MKVIAPVIQDRCSFVEVKPDSEKDYNVNLHEKIAATIFNSSCGSVSKDIPYSSGWDCMDLIHSWQYFIDYKTEKNWFIYPWNSFVMWYSTHWSNLDDWIYDVRWLMKLLIDEPKRLTCEYYRSGPTRTARCSASVICYFYLSALFLWGLPL